jgi:hypothetical protein
VNWFRGQMSWRLGAWAGALVVVSFVFGMALVLAGAPVPLVLAGQLALGWHWPTMPERWLHPHRTQHRN